jgi:hypothetical protein
MHPINILHDLCGRSALGTQIPNDQQKRGHSVKISDRFPTHCLVNMKKNAVPSVESPRICNRVPQRAPCTLQV